VFENNMYLWFFYKEVLNKNPYLAANKLLYFPHYLPDLAALRAKPDHKGNINLSPVLYLSQVAGFIQNLGLTPDLSINGDLCRNTRVKGPD